MNDHFMADRMYTNNLQKGMDDKFRRISAARVVGGYSGGSLWNKAIKKASKEYRSKNKSFSLRKPADVKYAKRIYKEMGGKAKSTPKRKRSGSKTLRLTGTRRKALKKTSKGKCSIYEPKNPKYWKEENGRCIKYSSHLRKTKKPKRRRGGVFLGDGEYEGDGVLLGGCDGCPYCGSGMY